MIKEDQMVIEIKVIHSYEFIPEDKKNEINSYVIDYIRKKR